ncbi:hypothetical protein [Labrenzia sp. DG1229]|uniref:hypothetical protein n=1 Tax=Labrenzia sp. DG1229 TaxID=681847 RepID=UPI00155D8C8E|nr:hypothetical protein [Labrenzia sp. DG1229]
MSEPHKIRMGRCPAVGCGNRYKGRLEPVQRSRAILQILAQQPICVQEFAIRIQATGAVQKQPATVLVCHFLARIIGQNCRGFIDRHCAYIGIAKICEGIGSSVKYILLFIWVNFA